MVFGICFLILLMLINVVNLDKFRCEEYKEVEVDRGEIKDR